MLIKLEKIISCTSEHPSYPASNLLQQRNNTSWRCAKPGELMASVIIQLAEPSCITGLDIGNYRCCIVVVTASTSTEPDKWLPIVNHQFMTHDEAVNGQFKDQVGIFTKKELNSENLKIKFDRVKVNCMQSANLREVFGLAFLVLRTEVVLELSGDVLGRFKLKTEESTVENFKAKCLKLFPDKQPTYKENLADKIRETGANNFAKRQEESKERRRTGVSLLEKTDADDGASNGLNGKCDAVETSSSVEGKKVDTPSSAIASSSVRRTPFGDVITPDANKTKTKNDNGRGASILFKKRSLYYEDSSDDEEKARNTKVDCSDCTGACSDQICEKCKKLQPQKKPENAAPPPKKPKVEQKAKKQFAKLFEDVKFSLSGYVNPQRDEIRRKALKMGGKYIVDPNTSNNKCTHLICAFKNTPKSQQLKGHTKIVSHKFIEECYDKKKRLPWRRFAFDRSEKSKSESEEEIEGSTSPVRPPNPYEQDTDSDSNY